MSAINKANDGMSAALLAEALLESGDLAAAQTTAAEAIALCRRSLRGADRERSMPKRPSQARPWPRRASDVHRRRPSRAKVPR